MNRTVLFWILILGVFLIAGCSQQPAATGGEESAATDDAVVLDEPTTTDETETVDEIETSDEPAEAPEAEPEEEILSTEEVIEEKPAVKEFRLEAFQFGYEPSVIEVNKGDTVRIIATSRDVSHGLALLDFGVNIVIKKGEETTVEFVADKSGEFTFYCSVPCGSGHGTMKGKLVVS